MHGRIQSSLSEAITLLASARAAQNLSPCFEDESITALPFIRPPVGGFAHGVPLKDFPCSFPEVSGAGSVGPNGPFPLLFPQHGRFGVRAGILPFRRRLQAYRCRRKQRRIPSPSSILPHSAKKRPEQGRPKVCLGDTGDGTACMADGARERAFVFALTGIRR